MPKPEPGKIAPALVAAYRATRYRVFLGDEAVTLRLHGPDEQTAALLADHDAVQAVLLTAWNPLSQPTPVLANERRQRELTAESSRRWTVLEGEGRSLDGRWPAEPSLLILGIDLLAARTLANRFQQLAFVLIDQRGMAHLIATDPDRQRDLG